MAAQLHPDDESPFGRPFSSSDHTARGGNVASPTSASSVGGGGATALPAQQAGPAAMVGVRPEMVNRFDGGAEDVNAAVLIPGQEQAVVTISTDRSVRVWLLRDSGQYWPSICHYMNSAATSLCYHHPTRTAFVGLESGLVSEFILADDYNRMDHKRDYLAHQARVAGVKFCHENKWMLSVGKDKYFQFHCTDTGRRLGGYQCGSSCTALEYDSGSRFVYVGDYSGQITVLKLDSGGVQFVNSLKGQSGSVQCLHWDGDIGWLFSGSYDSSIFVWDIGGRQGTVYELHGHRSKVTGLRYSSSKKVLLSCSDDSHLVVWDMEVRREQTADWVESDTCQLCSKPFFWNFRAMYDQKQLGMRQHHCRKCGRAVCSSCSTKTVPLPLKGHEFPVRVCEECYIKVSDVEKASHAKFFETKHKVGCLDLDEERDLMITVGADRVVKIWTIKGVL